MANSIWITGSGEAVFGTSLNKNQTDNFLNSGVGNTFTGIGGNINITGIASSGDPLDPPTDDNTAVLLKSTSGTISGVTDKITPDGATNSLTDTTPTKNSTISFTVRGNGGGRRARQQRRCDGRRHVENHRGGDPVRRGQHRRHQQ